MYPSQLFILFGSAVWASLILNKFNEQSHFWINGMEVLILKSPFTNDSFASLSINKSPFEEPAKYPGFTHLLEHLITFGKGFQTESFHDYIVRNSGYTNAHTDENGIGIKFRITTKLLPESLKRFAELFINPDFDQHLSDDPKIKGFKEITAIHKEFDLKCQNPEIVVNHYASLYDPVPYNRFYIGNRKTLFPNSPDLVEEMKKFFEEEICTNVMKLVVVTDSPLVEVGNLIIQNFIQVKQCFNKKSIIQHGEINAGRITRIYSRNQALHVIIPLEIDEKYPEEKKIYDFFSDLITINVKNSLFNFLCRNEYISRGDATFRRINNYGKIRISFKLHDSKNSSIYLILNALFNWINLLLKGSPQEQDLYAGFIRKHKFQSFSESLDTDFVDDLVVQMQKGDIQNVLTHSGQYCQEIISHYFSKIKMIRIIGSGYLLNFNAILASNQELGDINTSSDIDFEIEHLNLPINIKLTEKNFGFEYPSLNPYIFQGNLEPLYDSSHKITICAEEKPLQFSQFWVKTDFPIISHQIILDISFPLNTFDPKTRQLFKFFFYTIENTFAAEFNLALEAGFLAKYNYEGAGSFKFSLNGFGVDNVLKLLKSFLALAQNSNFEEELFLRRKEIWILSLENQRAFPVEMYLKYFNQIISNSEISDQEELEIVKNLTAKDFKDFLTEKKYTQLAPRVLLMCTNIDQKAIDETNKSIKSVFGGQIKENPPQDLNGRNFSFGPFPILNIVFSIIKLLSIPPGLEIEQTSFVYLFKCIFNSFFFTSLRLKDQKAYYLKLEIYSFPDKNLIEFVIASPDPVEQIESRINRFIDTEALDHLNSLSNEELIAIKESLIETLNPTKADFTKTSELILERLPDFNFIPQVVQFLEPLKAYQIKEEITRILAVIADPQNGFKILIHK
jgi:secreted Zn-dependent insulinase-like peptidase